MKVVFLSSFARDLRRVREGAIREQVRATILAVEGAADLRKVSNVRKLAGGGPYFRIRVAEYRIGLRLEGDTAVFVRLLPRREIYRFFP